MEKLFDYIFPSPTFMADNHLCVKNADGSLGQPTYCLLDIPNRRWWQIKGKQGFPWDGNTWDDNYVYQSITENVWTDPHTFKIFASSSWPGGGIVWMPRTFAGDGTDMPIVTGDSAFRIYSNCTQFTRSAVGQVSISVELGAYVDFQGDLGEEDCLIQNYEWFNSGQPQIERNFFVKGYGHVCWQLWGLKNGLFVKTQESLFNSIQPGGTPALNFPCPIPVVP